MWAPCLRYRNGTFYIFDNIRGQPAQIFSARNPVGPWSRTPVKRAFHDLSVLFDDDGKAYVIWGYRNLMMARLDETLTDVVPGTERGLLRTWKRPGGLTAARGLAPSTGAGGRKTDTGVVYDKNPHLARKCHRPGWRRPARFTVPATKDILRLFKKDP